MVCMHSHLQKASNEALLVIYLVRTTFEDFHVSASKHFVKFDQDNHDRLISVPACKCIYPYISSAFYMFITKKRES